MDITMDRTLEEIILDKVSQQKEVYIGLIESMAEEHEDNLNTYYAFQDLIDKINDLEDEE